MDLRETFFGSKLRIALTGLGILVALIVLLYLLGVIGLPAVVGVENAFDGVNRSTTVIQTELTVNNPNPIAVQLGGVSVDYTALMNDIPMANGSKSGISVGTENSTLTFHSYMDNSRIPQWWVSHLTNGERTSLRVRTTVCSETVGTCGTTTPVNREIETDILGGFNSSETRPVNANQPIVSDPVAYINESAAHWGDISQARTPIIIRFRVYNPKAVPLTITTLGYNVSMNGVDMGEGRVEENVVIPSHESRIVRTTVVLENDKLDEWWVTHLERDQVTTLRLDFYARLELPVGTVRVPLDGLTHEKTIETDFFDNKPDEGDGSSTTTTSPGGTTTTAPTTAGTTTSDDGGLLDTTTTTASTTTTSDSTTTTATQTTTTTEATTTTDDGLLARDSPTAD